MRSLRPDPIFDQIIGIVFPNRDEMDQHERQLLEKLNSSSNRKALVSSIEEGKRHQAERRGRGRMRKRGANSELDDGEAGPSASTSEAGSVRGGPRGESEMTDGSSADPDGSKIFLEIVPSDVKTTPGGKSYAKKWKYRLIKVKSCATGIMLDDCFLVSSICLC